MALVLPATILKIKSTKWIRQLLVDNYHIQYIITTSQRSAFSESAQFRLSINSIMEQLSKVNPLRKEIDKLVLKTLGFSDTKIQKLIDQLYPVLADEIQKLKTLMEG